MNENIANAWKTTRQQVGRYAWLYIFGLVNGFMAFYLFKSKNGVSMEDWISSGTTDTTMGPMFLYSLVTNVSFLISLVIIYRVMSHSIGVKLTTWRFIKIQVPALFSALLLSFTIVAFIGSLAMMILSDHVEEKMYLVVILVLLSFFTGMFYFIFAILYLKRYGQYDEDPGMKLRQVDYVKAFWTSLKLSPIAFLHFVLYTLVLVAIKYTSIFLNIQGFAGLGVFTDALSIPVMLFVILVYVSSVENACSSSYKSVSA